MTSPTNADRLSIAGIHHITAIAGPAQRNLDFYVGLLGLRLVKKTVNFDDPSTFHLYYGDNFGQPGTILTFFPWTGVAGGRPGTGAATAIGFTVPEAATGYWLDRLAAAGVKCELPTRRFGNTVVCFEDADGLALELVSVETKGQRLSDGSLPPERSISGFSGVTLSVNDLEKTGALLTEVMGLDRVAEEGTRIRFRSPGEGPGSIVDLLHEHRRARALMGSGIVHHVAFRARDDDEQSAWREKIVRLGFDVTPVLDRTYFRSIYFREPAGVLFEIATDPPGFTVDEEVDSLGSALKLPAWLEPHRKRIESELPPLRTSASTDA